MVNAIEAFDAKHMKPAEEIPAFRPGDTVDVNVKIKEGNNSRIQTFTGVVIARQGAGVRETFVVRKISFGTGVERRFPLHSPASTPSRWCAGPRASRQAVLPARCAARLLVSSSVATTPEVSFAIANKVLGLESSGFRRNHIQPNVNIEWGQRSWTARS